MTTTDRFPMEPPDEDWIRDNPDWKDRDPGRPDDWRKLKPINGHVKADAPDKAAGNAAPMPRIINPADLANSIVPARTWIVEDWLPVGCVTLNYADGGTGKSLLAQQLMTSTAIDIPWCGYETTRCRSFGLFCEDDEAELHRRQVNICSAHGLNLGGLWNMRWISGVGFDNELMTFDFDRPRTTELFAFIQQSALDFGARLLVLDTAADLFGGNENDRKQVRRFMNALGKLALDFNGAVLLNAHPSRDGLKTGNLDGASTAWNNSARSRWSLARDTADSNEPNKDNGARVLTRRKANYATIGATIRLQWRDGVLAPLHSGVGVDAAITRAAIEATFLDLLDRCMGQGQSVSHQSCAQNYAPRLFARRTDRAGYTIKEFEVAMTDLFTCKKIRVAEYSY